MLKRVLLALCCLLTACSEQQDAPLPGPTPRELLFDISLPDHLRLSPDGAWVSFSQAFNGARNIWLKPATSDAPARPITQFEHPGVGPHVWDPTGKYLLFLRQTPGADDVRPYVYDLQSQTTRALLGNVGQQASFLAFSSTSLPEVYVQTNVRGAGLLDIYKVNLETNAPLLVYQDDLGANGFFAGPDLSPLIAQVPLSDGGFEWRLRTQDGAWRLWGEVPAGDALTTRMENVSSDGQSIFLTTSIGRATAAFAAVPVEERFEPAHTKVLAAQDRYDFADASYTPGAQKPFLATFSTPRPSFVPLDQRLISLVFGMRASDSGALMVSDVNASGTRWLIGHAAASQPVKWGVFDQETSRKTLLFPEQDALLSQQSAVLPQVVKIPLPGTDVEDNAIDGFLTLPLGLSRDANGRLESAVPTVILLRGALASHDSWRYDPLHQWLASRGVAVLSLNHRGSTGQGKGHLFPDAGRLEAAIKADVRTAMGWLTAQNIAADKRAIVASGISTATALSFSAGESDGQTSCVALAQPVLSLQRALQSFPAHQSGLAQLLGDTFAASEAGAAYPKVPTFVAIRGGTRRERAGDVFEWAAQAKVSGTPLTLVALSRAEEDLSQGSDGRAVMAVMEQFLSSCLGFEAEPLTYADFKDAQLDVIEAPDALMSAVAAAQTEPALSR
ncbi:MAG: hypothetical protein AAF337_10265 [Pseudomonadota bacterium]